METEFKAADVAAAARRVAAALKADQDMLTELDQAVGDGDLGVTAVKLCALRQSYCSLLQPI